MKQAFGRSYPRPALYYSILLYFILSIAIVAIIKHSLLQFVPIMPAFYFLFRLPIIPIILPANSMEP